MPTVWYRGRVMSKILHMKGIIFKKKLMQETRLQLLKYSLLLRCAHIPPPPLFFAKLVAFRSSKLLPQQQSRPFQYQCWYLTCCRSTSKLLHILKMGTFVIVLFQANIKLLFPSKCFSEKHAARYSKIKSPI